MTQKTLEQRIGIFFRDRREAREDQEKIFEILRNNGYKDKVFEGGFTDDVTLFGNPKKYKIEYKFGKPLIEGRYALVPVSFYDSYTGNESAFLTIVDRANKKAKTIVDAGGRGVHYHGKCEIKPTAIRVREDSNDLIFTYDFTLKADMKNPIKVSESIWSDYMFRYKDHRFGQFDLKNLEAKK